MQPVLYMEMPQDQQDATAPSPSRNFCWALARHGL